MDNAIKQSKSREASLTFEQINADRLIKLSEKYWSSQNVDDRMPFEQTVIDGVYEEDLLGTKFSMKRSRVLEFSQYLENFLWPNFEPEKATLEHILSIAAMVNEKFRQRVPAWTAMEEKPQHVPVFFRRIVLESLENVYISYEERTVLILFLTHSFNSIEHEFIREQLKHYTTISLLTCVQEGRRSVIFRKFKNWGKIYAKLMKRGFNEVQEWNRQYMHLMLLNFISELEKIPEEGDLLRGQIHYYERFLEFIIDLETALPTRRFFNFLLADSHFVLRCSLSPFYKREDASLFRQLLDILKFYAKFEIDEETGEPLTFSQVLKIHYDSVHALQMIAYNKIPDLRSFSLSSVASVDSRDALVKTFSKLNYKTLLETTKALHLIPINEKAIKDNKFRVDKTFVMEMLVSYHEKEVSQLEKLNSLPLYPTENIIWDENIVPCEYYSGDCCLPLPKLNLQFLTFHDYLYRNLTLFRLESTYDIKQDIEDSIVRLSPWLAEDGSTYFGGWARMAQPITSFAVVEVSKPNVGERKPSFVRADVTVTLNLRNEIKAEWESLRKHDVCFLITVRPKMQLGTQYDYMKSVVEQSGLVYVRGCEVEGMLDETGRVIEDGPEGKPNLPGDSRTFRVFLDTNQYKIDMDNVSSGKEDVYETFNIIMRRKPNVNNFKAVLETIRELMNSDCVVPEWLRDLILGYGDPAAASFIHMSDESEPVDFNDTFINYHHVKTSFPDYEIIGKDGQKIVNLSPPYRITLKDRDVKMKPSLIIEPQPLLEDNLQLEYFKRNIVWFTPTQVKAIHSGLRHGLTLVVGPPGTGKTDVAVQIINNLYHSHPNERTLIVTHSNQALNHLFEKITQLDINEKHLLRLGHGEEALETDKDFSRYGRVNHILASRMYFLSLVYKLQQSLEIYGDMSQSCETAGYFYKHHVFPLWEKFTARLNSKLSKGIKPSSWISQNFPFCKFFSYTKPLFSEESFDKDWKIAIKHFNFIQRVFEMLEMCQAFELLRSGGDRANYLLVKEAKIIAMTCTHAALKRSELVKLGFTYDNILMEEAAQILEIETFIPLLIQNPQDGYNRLKRWIMIGDHHQLPPIVKNMAFQHYSNLEQSLFTRFVRLGVPTIELDAQGRARPSLCKLYSWRYQKLGNLPHVETSPEFIYANAGFLYDFQLINVENFNGVGESEPNPHFYQNLAEAEYCVAVFMYMRLLGYPANKISILTTYNGQKHLLRDVVNARCGNNPMIGVPHKVTTVDKYQGQQNDYILLSLVRTKTVGHIRDVRRLVVALSRARLGLYVFARESLFSNCFELAPAIKQLTARPLKLCLLPDEPHPTLRKQDESAHIRPFEVQDMAHMVRIVFQLYNQKMEAMSEALKENKAFYKPGDVEGRAPDHMVAIHPGAGSDSEDEE